MDKTTKTKTTLAQDLAPTTETTMEGSVMDKTTTIKTIMVALIITILAVMMSSNKALAASDGFYGVRDTYLEAGSNFSTTKGIQLIENGKSKKYSVYLYKKATGYKRVSSTHYINRRINGTYMLRYQSASGKHKAWRKVVVKDTKAPKFTGISNKTINQYSSFSTVQGVSAWDLADGKRGFSVYLWKNGRYGKVSKYWYINTKYAGRYQLKYIVKDKKGNKTTKYRTIIVKKVAKKTSKPIKITNTVRITARYKDERGFWYEDFGNVIYHHSYAGEAFANMRVGTKLIVNNCDYVITDKFTVWASYPLYKGSSYSKQGHYVSRGGKSAESAIANAPLKLKTCYDAGYSKDLYLLAKPLTSKRVKLGGSAISVSAPQ